MPNYTETILEKTHAEARKSATCCFAFRKGGVKIALTLACTSGTPPLPQAIVLPISALGDKIFSVDNERAWSERWEIVESFKPSGQGQAHRVKSRDPRGMPAVLKELKNCKEPKARARMYAEVTNLTAAHLAGAKVPKYLDGNVAPENLEGIGNFYFVMEYIDGPTLKELIEEEGALSFEQAIAITLDLCESLQAAKTIIHRDIKPDNMKIRDGRSDVVLLDYGLSFNQEQDKGPTEVGEPFGNRFLYLPEFKVVNSNQRDARSDLSLACGILFYCLTGIEPRSLFDENKRPPHLKHAAALEKAVGPRWGMVRTFFSRGFQVSIEDRFGGIGELIKRLESLRETDPSTDDVDLTAIAQQADNALRQQNPRMRAKDCAERLPLFQLIFGEELKKLSGSIFKVSALSDDKHPIMFDRADNDVRIVKVRVHVEAHPEITKNLFLRIKLEGSECVVYKELFPGDHLYAVSTMIEPIITSRKEVYRYPMDEKPDTARLCIEFRKAVAELIGQLEQALTP